MIQDLIVAFMALAATVGLETNGNHAQSSLIRMADSISGLR
jgi:hypothetical protein